MASSGYTLVLERVDIKAIIFLVLLLNMCTFCLSLLITLYYRNKYNINFIGEGENK
jgi:hypothetical protein